MVGRLMCFAMLACTLAAAVPLSQTGVIDPNDQSGGEVKNVATQKTTSADEAPSKVAETPLIKPELPFNLQNMSYPVANNAVLSHVSSEDLVAAPAELDPTKQDVHGVSPGVVDLGKDEKIHPMEHVTPLVDNFPCDVDRILTVDVPAATAAGGWLPSEYGCSDWNDSSREKASPEISFTNVSADVVGFSMDIVDIGDESCKGVGPTTGKILWSVRNITVSHKVRFIRGASKDPRTLNGGHELPNQWLEEYYSGPCPAPGDTGCYRVKVLAHREAGICQCGHFDFKFGRREKPREYIYNGLSKVAPPPGVAPIEDPMAMPLPSEPSGIPDPGFKPGATFAAPEDLEGFAVANKPSAIAAAADAAASAAANTSQPVAVAS